MTIEFADYDLTPKEFSLLLHTSVSQLKDESKTTEYTDAMDALFAEIEGTTGIAPSTWLKSPLSDSIDLTPLQVWKYSPSLSLLLSDPVKALDACFPDWRLMNANGIANFFSSNTTKVGLHGNHLRS